MKPWATYFGVLAICCIVCPPLIGIAKGIALFCVLWWLGFKMLGG